MKSLRPLVNLLLGVAVWFAATTGAIASVHADDPTPTATDTPTAPALSPTPAFLSAADLVTLINGVRTGNGLKALVTDPILMGTAQSAANTMADYHLSSQIGDVRGRVMAAGYGAKDVPWAMEDFAVLPVGSVSKDILLAWSDAAHMKPMTDPIYMYVGAGVAFSTQGDVYYVLEAAYTSNRIYKPGATLMANAPTAASLSQSISAVRVAKQRADGTTEHVVRAGDTLWSIAIAYGVAIEDLQRLNGYSRESFGVYEGQKLRIPTRSPTRTPFPTLTPVVVTATPVISRDAPVNLTVSPAATPAPTSIFQAADPAEVRQTITTILIVLVALGVMLIAFGILFRD